MAELRFPYPEQVFTPVFNKLYQHTERFIINYGGTGSSKSFSAAQKEILLAVQSKIKTLVIRKVGSTLRDSVIPSFRARIEQFELDEVFFYHKGDRMLLCTETGSEIIFRGLDDPEKLKSFEGLNRIMVEEASELSIEDFYELNRRARGVPDIQITLNFNPVHETHWLKKHFFDQKVPDSVFIHSTYKQNPFLSKKDREQIEWMKEYNYNQYRVYALGEWGLTENGNPWLFAFSREKHVKPVIQYLPQFEVYLSFDFNRDPVTCVALQQTPNKGDKYSFVHAIKEFSTDQQLSELCARIKATFPGAILFVTGDASGNSGNVGYEKKNASLYSMIQSYLGLTGKQMHVNSHNLEHNDSRNLINTLLYSYPSIFIAQKVLINGVEQEGCPKLIADCELATVDEDSHKPGHLKKDREIYKMDLFDAYRYFWQTYFLEYCNKVFWTVKR